jgi:TonB-dependent starch-binding outer membrane protein SusC
MNVRNLKSIAAIALCMLFALQVAAQNATTGRVVNKDGTGIPGVSVSANGKVVAITDNQGNFRANVSSGTLSFSSVGYEVITASSGSGIEVTMNAKSGTQSEVVVIGYGSSKKSDLTGSLTRVSAKEFNRGPNQTVDQLIQGKVAGLVVQRAGNPYM